MIRRILRLGLFASVVGGASFVAFRFVQSRRATHDLPPTSDWLPPKRPEKPLIEPEMLQGLSLKKSDSAELDQDQAGPDAGETGDGQGTSPSWVEPEGSSCPEGYPVKAKLSSGIYHLPGMLAYERTTPDRCYADESSAEADGLRKAKR